MQTSLIISPAYTMPIEARLTNPTEPGLASTTPRDWFVAELLWRYGDQEERVDPRTALTYSFIYSCVSYISQTIAALGWHVFQRSPDGRAKLPIEDNIAWTLGMQANPEMTAFAFREVMLKDALTWGNGYAEIERTNSGRVLWFWRLDPSRVWPMRDSSQRLVYQVTNDDGSTTYLYPADVFHLKNIGSDGLVGYSPIELARRAIETGMAEERFGKNFFARGPMPGGLLEIPGNVKKEERDAMRKSFEQTYGGSHNAGRVVVLTGGTKFTPVTLPNSDAQWIEAQQFSGEQIARIFRVPQHKVGLLAHSTNNNIEQQSIEAVQDCLLPWCRRLETEADIKLFGSVTMGRKYTQLNLSTLLRGDTATQTASVVQKVNNGLMTVNEGRELFDMNPIDGGDTPLVQGAMVPLERVLEEPPPPPAPSPPGPPPEPAKQGQDGAGASPPDQMPQDVRTTFLALLEDAYGRLLRVEADKARRADKQGNLSAWAEAYYSNGATDHVAAVLRPLMAGLLLASGRSAGQAGALAGRLAADHNGRSVAVIRSYGLANVDDWQEARAPRQAARHLDLAWNVLTNCGGPGGPPGPCPGGGDGGEKGTGSPALHEKADAAAKSWLQRAKELPAKVLAGARDKIAAKYEQLKGRYGKGMALAIMGAGILATPIPIPGTTLIAVAPLIGAAEIYRAAMGSGKTKGAAGTPTPDEGMTDAEIEALGKEWMNEVLAEWEAEDVPALEQE